MNDDLISRQAVLDGIEELKKSPWATDKHGNGFEYLIAEALDVVADLCVKREPSVNPQEPCEDANANQHNSNALNALEGDLISRQAAIDAVNIGNLHPGIVWALQSILEELPSVTPQEPKTGHWESFDLTYGRDIYKCSVCKCTADVPTVLGIPMFKYCPNCGAKMESEDKR